MVTAVSPNVVVDILLRLREENLGLYKGIHTIIITVTTCSDVLSIFLFGLVLGLIFSTGKNGLSPHLPISDVKWVNYELSL